jgi:hypothetical protein
VQKKKVARDNSKDFNGHRNEKPLGRRERDTQILELEAAAVVDVKDSFIHIKKS